MPELNHCTLGQETVPGLTARRRVALNGQPMSLAGVASDSWSVIVARTRQASSPRPSPSPRDRPRRRRASPRRGAARRRRGGRRLGHRPCGLLRFLAAPPPTPERMTAVLAQVHEVIRAADDDLDIDPALAACVQLSLAGPRPAPDSPSAPPPMTLCAFGMNLHAATTADGRDRKQPRANLPLPPAPALRPRRRHGAPRRPRPCLLQGALAQRHRPRRHGRPPVPRPPLRPGPATRLPHDPLLRCVRQPPSPARARHPQAPRTAATAAARAGLRPARRLARFLAQLLAAATTHRVGKAPRPRLRARHHPLPKMRRPHACPRGRLRCRRHRPNPPRRPRSPCASSSWTGPVVPLTARPFGDVFTRLRLAAVLAAPLGTLAGHFVTLALPLALRTVPKSPDRGLPAARRAAPYLPSPPNSRFELLKRGPCRGRRPR